MFCEKCGAKISKDDAFCTNCGSPVKKEEVVETEETTVNETETETTVEVENTAAEEVQQASEPVEQPVLEPRPAAPVIEKEKVKKGSKGGVVVIILVVLLLLAAIGVGVYFLFFRGGKDSDPVSSIEKAVNNMVDMNSFTVSASIDASAEGTDISATVDLSLDFKNKKGMLNANATASGMSLELPAYLDLSDSDNSAIYFKLPEILDPNSSWQKISLDGLDLDELFGEEDSEHEQFKFKDEFKELDLFESVKSDVKGTKKYKFTIDEKTIKKIKEIDDTFDYDFDQLKESGFENGFAFYIYVNEKDNYISKIYIDMAEYYKPDGTKFDKFDFSIEIKDINKVKEIEIPSAAKKAKEIDLSELIGGSIGGDLDYDYDDDDDDDDDDDYVDDFAITDYGFKVAYKMPANFEPSFVNDDEFKIYRNDDKHLRVVMSNYWDTVDEVLEDFKSEKESAAEDYGYKNLSITEEKKLTVNGKEFSYMIASYEAYGTKNYEAVVCYELDDEHIYKVEYEKTEEELTEADLKLFLDITVTKK